MTKILISSLFFAGLLVGTAGAQMPETPAVDTGIYGWQLMTPAERSALRERMRDAETAEERERIRNEHHAKMDQRAKARGMELRRMQPGSGPANGPGDGHMMQKGGKGQKGTPHACKGMYSGPQECRGMRSDKSGGK